MRRRAAYQEASALTTARHRTAKFVFAALTRHGLRPARGEPPLPLLEARAPRGGCCACAHSPSRVGGCGKHAIARRALARHTRYRSAQHAPAHRAARLLRARARGGVRSRRVRHGTSTRHSEARSVAPLLTLRLRCCRCSTACPTRWLAAPCCAVCARICALAGCALSCCRCAASPARPSPRETPSRPRWPLLASRRVRLRGSSSLACFRLTVVACVLLCRCLRRRSRPRWSSSARAPPRCRMPPRAEPQPRASATRLLWWRAEQSSQTRSLSRLRRRDARALDAMCHVPSLTRMECFNHARYIAPPRDRSIEARPKRTTPSTYHHLPPVAAPV